MTILPHCCEIQNRMLTMMQFLQLAAMGSTAVVWCTICAVCAVAPTTRIAMTCVVAPLWSILAACAAATTTRTALACAVGLPCMIRAGCVAAAPIAKVHVYHRSHNIHTGTHVRTHTYTDQMFFVHSYNILLPRVYCWYTTTTPYYYYHRSHYGY
jgi:hypothetical protein